MTQVRSVKGSGSIDFRPVSPPGPPQRASSKPEPASLRQTGSRSVSGALSNASRRASDTASQWLRKTASCLTGHTSGVSEAETVHFERRPSEDIVLMVHDQQRRYEDVVRKTKSEIRIRQRQNAFLQTQLEAIKKTNPKQKTLMRAVDELDGMVLAARKLELKLQLLHEEHEILRRKVFSNQSAQQALESLGGNRLTIQDDAWYRDLDIFAKLAYAGLLKGHEEQN